jgi:hypothetical protein
MSNPIADDIGRGIFGVWAICLMHATSFEVVDTLFFKVLHARHSQRAEHQPISGV